MSFTRLLKGIEHRNGLWHWRSIRTRYGLRMPLRVPSSCHAKPCSISIMPASTRVFSVSTTFSWVWLPARSASTHSTVHSSISGRKITLSTVTVTSLPPTATMTLANYGMFGTNKRALATPKRTLRFHIESRILLHLTSPFVAMTLAIRGGWISFQRHLCVLLRFSALRLASSFASLWNFHFIVCSTISATKLLSFII